MLSERLSKIQKPIYECQVQRLKGELPAEDATALDEALEGRLSIRLIHTAIREEGYRISRESLANHRMGRCLCGENK